MAFTDDLQTLGEQIAFGLSNKTWSLVVDETSSLPNVKYEVIGQTRPTNWNVAYQSNVGVSSTLGSYDPPTLPTGSSPTKFSFSAEFVPKHAFDDISSITSSLEKMMRKDSNLNRQPLLLFSHADYNEHVWLTGLSVSIPDGVWKLSGYPIRTRVDITLTVARSRDLEFFDPTSPEPSTTYHTLGQGESPESAALIYLGDPLLGVKIRQNNPQYIDPVAGDRLKILPAAHSKMRGRIRPKSVCLKSTVAVRRFDTLAALRFSDNGVGYANLPDSVKLPR